VCQIPKFSGSMPTSWFYVIVPILIYLSERILRFIRGLQKREIAYYKLHPSDVLELAIDNSNSNKINYETGQYIYLKVKSLSLFEWHPFTITSAPDDQNLTVHIRLTGDWTKELKKKITSKTPANNYSEGCMKPAFDYISIDGPYGSSAEDIFKYREVMLIGAGIGVTPYASILKHILNKIEKDPGSIKVEKVRFYWICQNTG
jgi:predicted ferric reductase